MLISKTDKNKENGKPHDKMKNNIQPVEYRPTIKDIKAKNADENDTCDTKFK